MSRFAPQDKLALHPQFSAYMRGERVYPVNVEISPSGVCQASCAFCFYANTGELGEHRKVMLRAERLSKLIDECASLGVKSITWTGGGDPSLYPSIATSVAKVDLCGMQQGMFTNALSTPMYSPERMSWIRVTMTDKPYKPDCIKPLRAAKTLGFAFNYSGPQDDDYLRTTLALAEDVKADYVQVRPALKFHGETVDIEPPAIVHSLLEVTGYKFEDAKKPHGYARCEGYHFIPFVWEDGRVDVCAYMRKHEGYNLGDLYKDSFKDILDRAPQSVAVHKNCQVCCRLHEFNQAIHKSRDLEDRNFP